MSDETIPLILKNNLRIILGSKQPEKFRNIEAQRKGSYSYRKSVYPIYLELSCHVIKNVHFRIKAVSMICSEVQQELYQSAIVMNSTIEQIEKTKSEVCISNNVESTLRYLLLMWEHGTVEKIR